MGRRCCVAGCPSTSRLPEHHGVTYHSFPLDAVIRAIWIKNSRISLDRQITKSVLVCSRHFRRLDFHTIRNGKYLLKPRVFPTVFPWGKMDASEIEADHRALQQATVDGAAATGAANNSTSEDVIKATVDAIVAQILAETAERNAAAAAAAIAKPEVDAPKPAPKVSDEGVANTNSVAIEKSEDVAPMAVSDAETPNTNAASPAPPSPPKYGPPTNLIIGARLEKLNSEGAWMPARIVEVNDAEQTLLIRLDRNNKLKTSPTTNGGTQEWMAIKSERLRQRVSARVLPIFELEEKCMARWSGPRKFPGTVKKLLGNDTYEVLFDDGYTKNVRAVHMNKLPRQLAAIEGVEPLVSVPAAKRPSGGGGGFGSNKKGKATPQRKDWPLLDMSNLDFAALGLPEIPRDGEWTCHWVNDQPIGAEGFLIVGEHHKPTVIVQDWRLPPGWIKHMYQRSNVLGKWDVILVSPSGKRFRSKSDLKVFLESQNLVYNPDVYDFSIHRRRAKDINAYVYTHDYSPQQPSKPKHMDVSFDTSATMETSTTKSPALSSTPVTPAPTRRAAEESQYMEAPVASLMPPAELMSPQAPQTADVAASTMETIVDGGVSVPSPALGADEGGGAPVENGFAFIGGLKVQITDNLFVCPREGCGKTYRKEDFLQIHIRHYHKEFAQHVSHCPKMQELAIKRTHPSSTEQADAVPKNQIPNQQFFAKLHQQDIQHSRSFRRQATTTTATSPTAATPGTPPASTAAGSPNKGLVSPKLEPPSTPTSNQVALSPTVSTTADATPSQLETAKQLVTSPLATQSRSAKRSRFSSNRSSKRQSGSRKSSRQRTQRRDTNLQHSVGQTLSAAPDYEETRQSFNTPTPEGRRSGASEVKKRRIGNMGTPISSIDSPATADSVSTPSSNEPGDINAALAPPLKTPGPAPQYIKENGELIRIVRMRQEEIINCICEYGEEDGLMIQCELCLCWQHGACNGIVKESDVPDKYVCYICRNPQRVRDSMRFKHDQDWLFEGKLPVANYHTFNPQVTRKFELLKRSHTLTGNLLDAKRSMHSLLVKINIAKNRSHPKLYLWAKKWDEDKADNALTPVKRIKTEAPDLPHVPQPEAAIDPEECQYRLIEHVKVQQGLVMNRLNDIEAEMDQLEKEDNLVDLKDSDISGTKEAVATFIKELETLKRLAKLNNVANMKKALKEQELNTLTV
ncbi:uncharacterized protein LOC115624059 [Scaptodrosophila lebanonensis]|uniref:Uncharacterized protein LOC115624059 n=1 Tax=Drosophila lebanonensis TaxID=7225 RepID=A0A6J2THC1_DROLE|nr:uncharacterized protein LOC115624059 [Scaptodrosophila lebanonensis]XP_030374503.1 uncharacterized protein LOC115624059 [Scaptodrosophila lebanonensis]